MLILALALVGLALPIWDLARPGGHLRLAIRNLGRRRGEALLVVGGSLLGTAIITASFLVGDTFNASIRDTGRTKLGPIDERVVPDDPARLAEVERRLAGAGAPAGVDGMTPAWWIDASVAAVGPDRRAEPSQRLTAYRFPDVGAFGGERGATGLRDVAGIRPGHAVLNAHLARKLRVGAGDRVDLFAYGRRLRVQVAQVVPQVGLAGYGDLFVPRATLDQLSAPPRPAGAEPPHAEVLVSNTGGVFTGADRTDQVTPELRARVRGLAGVTVEKTKAELLDDATSQGRSTGQLFTGIGVFSVLAGILLLVNLFVMLAEERKTEMGILRALGYRRNHLMRLFASEGALYAVAAAVCGALLGIGLGQAIVAVTQSIFNTDDDLTLRFSTPLTSLLAGGGIGLLMSLATVWITSGRIARLNVIAAIRDLPEPKRERKGRVALLGAVGVVVSALAFLGGLVAPWPMAVVVAPILGCFCAMPVATALLPRRAAVPFLAAGAQAWGFVVFTVLPGATEGAGIPVFVAQGILLVAGAVTLLSQADRLWSWLADVVGRRGKGLAARLGLAYPLARVFRTAMLLAMYALVMFTLTFLAVFSAVFERQEPKTVAQVRGGRDVVVDASPANPPSLAAVRARPGVADAAVLRRALPELRTADHPELASWPMTGFDRSFLADGVPELTARLPRYRSDRAAFEGVLEDPKLVIVSVGFLRDSFNTPGASRAEPGDRVVARDPATGRRRTYRVAGVYERDPTGNGVLASDAAVRDLVGDRSVLSRFVVRVDPGQSPEVVARDLQAHFVAQGVEADSFGQVVHDRTVEQIGFFKLMQGYLGLGLIVGIAGLGVVMVRAVRERRREIGMLRAMGFPAGLVRRAFLLEAAFIAVQGIAVGVGLGLLTAYQIMVNSDAFSDQPLGFAVPWATLVAVAVLPFAFSLLATLWPAGQAARIRPAVALRAAD